MTSLFAADSAATEPMTAPETAVVADTSDPKPAKKPAKPRKALAKAVPEAAAAPAAKKPAAKTARKPKSVSPVEKTEVESAKPKAKAALKAGARSKKAVVSTDADSTVDTPIKKAPAKRAAKKVALVAEEVPAAPVALPTEQPSAAVTAPKKPASRQKKATVAESSAITPATLSSGAPPAPPAASMDEPTVAPTSPRWLSPPPNTVPQPQPTYPKSTQWKGHAKLQGKFQKGNKSFQRHPKQPPVNTEPMVIHEATVPHGSTEKPQYDLNFGYIKALATPGSWRRGYGYHKSGQVREVTPTETGISASVKGNYKDHYAIHLNFDPQALHAQCSCPLEEEWCKHAVAVALTACTRGLWHAYFGMEEEDPRVSENIVGTADLYMGSYRIFVSDGRKPNKISLKLQERQTGRLVKQIEPLLMQIIELQTNHGYEFNDATRREINLLKLLYQLGFMFTKDGWYHIPTQHAPALFEALALLEEVCSPQLERMVFEHDPLKLQMAVNVSLAGNVLVSLHWIHPSTGNALPLEEVRLFAPNCPFGMRRNRLYPLANTLHRLPKRLIKTTFTDIRDADGGKFMYEELPRLRSLVDELDESDMVHQLTLAHRPPQKMLNVEMMDPALLKIRVSLDFRYDTVTVPYSKATPKTPYVMVVNKDKEQIYWVKRDTKQEKAAYQQLLDSCLTPLQTNYLFAEGDDAIDFFNTALDHLGDEWEFSLKDPTVFNVLKVADAPLKVWAAIDFDESVDFFRLKVFCRIGDEMMDIDDVRDQMIQGKKYFLRAGAGYVEIPLAAILQFQRTLMALEAEKLADDPADGLDVYRIETFKVGLLQELTEQGVELELSPKFEAFWKLITSTSTLEDIPVPENVNAELRPYQKQGFNWLWFLYNYGLNGVLADDMGLGKTLQTLVLLQYAKNTDGHQPSIVVCPSSVVYNWVNEAHKFVPDLKVLQLTGTNRTPLYKKIKDVDLVITSYSIMRRDIRALKGYAFRHVVLDESQNIKNWSSQTAQSAKQLKANHRLAISGTPIENRLLELWSLFDFLMPKFLYDIDEFRYRFVTPIEEKGNIDAERRLKKQVFPFVLRRLKQDVAKDLPPKIENVMYCDLTDDQQELYLNTLERTRNEILAKAAGDGRDASANAVFAALMRLRQICCHPQMLDDDWRNGVEDSGKFDALKTMLQDVIANGHRVLVYSQFVEMLKIMRSWLEVEGIRYEYLTGDTPSAERGPKVDKFNNDESIPVFLISLKAGGTGLNLTGADYVILYDPWWNPAAENQAADRAHRIGQTKTVMVYRMVARGTVEEKIMKLKDRKQGLVDSIISADQAMGKAFSFEDLKDILTPDF